MSQILVAFLIALVVSLILTPLIRMAAFKWGVIDQPGGRRIHTLPTPRLGGVAVMAAFFIAFLILLPELAPNFKPKQLAGFSLAALVLLLVGIWDDKRGVSAPLQLASHVFCGAVLVAVGMGIDEITNPFSGDKFGLDWLTLTQAINGVDYHLNFPADLITVVWVVLVINALNWIDGLDGLASGVGGIGAITIALLALSPIVAQDHVAIFAALLAGALGGFLFFNWHPAKIFLGTVGSTFIGFTLATLAIISGGKVATALLVLGFPILDALAVILKRRLHGARAATPDNRHLHHLLLARGFSVRQAAGFIYALCASFGALALLTQTTRQKLIAFSVLVLLLLIVFIWLARPTQKGASRDR